MEATTIERIWFSYPEAQARTGLSNTTLWRAVRDGELRASGRGRGVKFNRDELDRFMRARGK